MTRSSSARPISAQSAGSREPDRLRAEQVARFKELTESVLPALAREARWPIRLDHCFKRICLDYAFEDVWYNHLPRPAERNIAGEPLQRALGCAEELATAGRPLLEIRNAESLRYRGKAGPHHTRTRGVGHGDR